jgi:hypothetical protein
MDIQEKCWRNAREEKKYESSMNEYERIMKEYKRI